MDTNNSDINDINDISILTDLYTKEVKEAQEISNKLQLITERFIFIRERIKKLRHEHDNISEDNEEVVEEEIIVEKVKKEKKKAAPKKAKDEKEDEKEDEKDEDGSKNKNKKESKKEEIKKDDELPKPKKKTEKLIEKESSEDTETIKKPKGRIEYNISDNDPSWNNFKELHIVKITYKDQFNITESFWVWIEKIENDEITGIISNDLITNNLRLGDRITFNKKHIREISERCYTIDQTKLSIEIFSENLFGSI
jgi:hypothetical protein